MDGTVIDTARMSRGRVVAAVRVVGAAFGANAYLFVITGLYLACALAVIALGYPVKTQNFGGLARAFFQETLPFQMFILFFLRCANLFVCVRPARPIAYLLGDLRDYFLNPWRLLNAVPVVAALLVFMAVFAFFKANIPNLAPFSWDERLMSLDRLLHGGSNAGDWLRPWLDGGTTRFLDASYSFWFFVMSTMWFGFAFVARPTVLRTRFFITFLLIWAVGGTGLAIFFSSAGPAFYARLGLDAAVFSDLLDYLKASRGGGSLFALETQDLLWSAYEGKQNVIAGISAMPSMHNASTLLFSLAAWKVDRRLGVLLITFEALIFVASVHLGWHYAVDVYAGYALTAILWAVAGPIAEWHERQSWSRSYALLLDRYSQRFSPVASQAAHASPSSRAARSS